MYTPTKLMNRMVYDPKGLEIKRENQCLVKRMQEIESSCGVLNPKTIIANESRKPRPPSAESLNRNLLRKQHREVVIDNMGLLTRLKSAKGSIKNLQ